MSSTGRAFQYLLVQADTMKKIDHKTRKCIVLIPVLFLLHVPVEISAEIQKRFGIELCKRHCARYNRCYGIRYNITFTTCTLLNDRNADGKDVHLSRSDILQRLDGQDDCSFSQFYSRLCIVNNQGRTVHVAEITTSLKEEIQTVDLKVASLRNLACTKGKSTITTCNIPAGNYSKTDVFRCVLIKEFFPGKRYLNQITFFTDPATMLFDGKIITLSVTDAYNLDFQRMTWNITYLSTDNRNITVYYYGQRGVSETKLPYLSGYLIFLFDRSSSGSFLHDLDFNGNVKGSIELPSLNVPLFIRVHVYLPLNTSFSTLVAHRNPAFEKALENWYTVHYNGIFF